MYMMLVFGTKVGNRQGQLEKVDGYVVMDVHLCLLWWGFRLGQAVWLEKEEQIKTIGKELMEF